MSCQNVKTKGTSLAHCMSMRSDVCTQCVVCDSKLFYTYSTHTPDIFYTYSTLNPHIFYTYSTHIQHIFYTYSRHILHIFYTFKVHEIRCLYAYQWGTGHGTLEAVSPSFDSVPKLFCICIFYTYSRHILHIFYT